MMTKVLFVSALAALAAGTVWLFVSKRRKGKQRLHRRKILVCEPSLTTLEEQYLCKAFQSTFISGGAGSFKDRFEKEFAALCGCAYGVSAANGTVAINLALAAAGLKRGDEVLVPSFTYVASAAAVVTAGGTPVFVDCDELGLMDPAAALRALTQRTRFLLAVHTYGHPPDMDALLALARPRGIIVIEDAAEAHGARYKGRLVGSLGDLATFSFYANKVMTTGEGGMVVTNDAALAQRLVHLRGHAMSAERRFWHTEVGFNYRLSNLQCALGVAQLERFDQLVAGRRRVIRRYRDLLRDPLPPPPPSPPPDAAADWSNAGGPAGGEPGCRGVREDGAAGGGRLRVNPHRDFCDPCPWLACVWLPEEWAPWRDEVCARLEARHGVETRPFFYAVHTMPPYRSYRMVTSPAAARPTRHAEPGGPGESGEEEEGAAAVEEGRGVTMSERVAARGFNLPTSVGLAEADLQYVAEALWQVLRDLGRP